MHFHMHVNCACAIASTHQNLNLLFVDQNGVVLELELAKMQILTVCRQMD